MAKIKIKYQLWIHTDQGLNPNSKPSRLCGLRKALISESSSCLYKIAKRTLWWERENLVTKTGYIVAIQEKNNYSSQKNMKLNAISFMIFNLTPWTQKSLIFSFFSLHPASQRTQSGKMIIMMTILLANICLALYPGSVHNTLVFTVALPGGCQYFHFMDK